MTVASLYTFHIAPLHLLLTDPTHATQARAASASRIRSTTASRQQARLSPRATSPSSMAQSGIITRYVAASCLCTCTVYFDIYLLTYVYDCAYFYRQPTPIYTSYLPCRLLPHHFTTCFRTSVAVAVANECLIRVVTHLLPSSSRLLFSLDPDLHHHHLHIYLFLSP